jgi:hypothetical protein
MRNVCLILNTISPVCTTQFLYYSFAVFAQPVAQGLAVRGLHLYFWGHKLVGMRWKVYLYPLVAVEVLVFNLHVLSQDLVELMLL